MIAEVTAGWRIDERDRQVDERDPGLLGEHGERVGGLELALVRRAATCRSGRGSRLDRVLAGSSASLAVAARQPAAGERAPRDHAHAVALADRQHVALDPADEHASRAAARRRTARGRGAPPTHCASTICVGAGTSSCPR